MKCIFCGNDVIQEYEHPDLISCPICNLQWTVAQHKDNQEWAVRHIRSLEEMIMKQQQQIDLLVKKLEGI